MCDFRQKVLIFVFSQNRLAITELNNYLMICSVIHLNISWFKTCKFFLQSFVYCNGNGRWITLCSERLLKTNQKRNKKPQTFSSLPIRISCLDPNFVHVVRNGTKALLESDLLICYQECSESLNCSLREQVKK